MDREVIKKGNFGHIYNRGVRKMPIVFNDEDKWRFLKSLRYLNDKNTPSNLFRDLDRKLENYRHFKRPKEWPPSEPLVKILSYCLMPNHFHLILKQITK